MTSGSGCWCSVAQAVPNSLCEPHRTASTGTQPSRCSRVCSNSTSVKQAMCGRHLFFCFQNFGLHELLLPALPRVSSVYPLCVRVLQGPGLGCGPLPPHLSRTRGLKEPSALPSLGPWAPSPPFSSVHTLQCPLTLHEPPDPGFKPRPTSLQCQAPRGSRSRALLPADPLLSQHQVLPAG